MAWPSGDQRGEIHTDRSGEGGDVIAVKFENADDALWIVACLSARRKDNLPIRRATSSDQSPVQLLLGEAAAECRPGMTPYKLWCCHRAGATS